jgi:hypothetical protein
MIKFLKYTLVFVLFLVAFKLIQLALVYTNLSSKDSSNFYGSSAMEKRIILVGSSNLDFNYDYQLLQNTFKEYAIVGCNLNEPSGFYATVHKLKKLNPKKDDIVIFCFPHSLYEPDKLIPLGSKGKKGFSSELLKSAARDFPLDFFKAVLNIKSTDTFKLLKEKPTKKTSGEAIQFNFETEADELTEFLECKKLDGAFNIQSTGFDADHLKKMLEYIENSFESKVWFRFPVVKESEYLVSEERLNYLDTHFPFINKFDNSIYEDQYWYNQWYHLNSCGRELNTSKLMDELTIELK